MCGIAGWYRRRGRPVDERTIEAQCDAIRHRGPDDSGVFVDGDFGFGMRRLSIVDIAGGHQPMLGPRGRLAIVFNGEIYNHLEVRAEIGRQYEFHSHCDTETVLAAYCLWGNDAWERLEGMFAAAIWDRGARTLTLARDPLGIKPLYVSENDGAFAFGSELKAITPVPDQVFSIDERAIDDYFTFGHVRRPRSIYREVRTLEPGSFLTVGPASESRSSRYWVPQYRQSPPRSDDEWIEEMRSITMATTARHMMADVPVAAFLSGGIDSSTILAAAVEANRAPVQAFTIGHPGHRIDETDAAAAIARHLGCEHVVMPLSDEAAMEAIPEIADCFDEPFADMAAIPTWFVSKLAAASVKVVLCGEGGDELFCGYKRHRNADAIARHRLLAGVARPFAKVAASLPPTRSEKLNRLRQYAGRFAEFAGAADGYQQFFLATQIGSTAVLDAVASPGLKGLHRGPSDLEADYFSGVQSGSRSALEDFVYADLTVNLPSDMLTRLDRASMAHSVEARVPFLSHKVVDWALAMPDRMKLRGGIGKFVLRRAARGLLPEEILSRPKQGFQVPMANWLRGPFGNFALGLWHDSGARLSGYLDESEVDRLFAEHRSGAADHSRLLYAVLIFSLWWSKHREMRVSPSLHAA